MIFMLLIDGAMKKLVSLLEKMQNTLHELYLQLSKQCDINQKNTNSKFDIM